MEFCMLRCLALGMGVLIGGSLSPGCGGGGGVVTPTVCIAFAPGSAPAPGTIVAAQTSTGACDLVSIDLLVTGVTDIFAASFTVDYDQSIASYDRVSTSGSLLASDGRTVEVLEDRRSGHVTIGLTRRGATTGIDAAGTALLVRLFFLKAGTAAGSGSLGFSNTKLLGSETPPQEKQGMQWSGGTLFLR